MCNGNLINEMVVADTMGHRCHRDIGTKWKEFFKTSDQRQEISFFESIVYRKDKSCKEVPSQISQLYVLDRHH